MRNFQTAPHVGSAVLLLFCLIQATSSIVCYHCNSAYDPRCADPFDSYSLGKVNCSMTEKLEHISPQLEPTLCRKATQVVYGEIRVVRGCGYVRDERDDGECTQRPGTHDVTVLYCACTTDLCNAAPTTHAASTVFALVAPITLIMVMMMRTHLVPS